MELEYSSITAQKQHTNMASKKYRKTIAPKNPTTFPEGYLVD